jgi:UPF0716 family protein affecting phage T7 exclusion
MQSLTVRFRRFTWGLGTTCGLTILLTLILFIKGNALLGMYTATFLVFLVPVMVGFLIFKQELGHIVEQLNRSKELASNPSHQEQSQLSASAD